MIGVHVTGNCVNWFERAEGNRRMGSDGTSASGSSNAESSWRLNELTERVVTIEVGIFFQ